MIQTLVKNRISKMRAAKKCLPRAAQLLHSTKAHLDVTAFATTLTSTLATTLTASVAVLTIAGTATASGWRIPEQSVDSTAKGGANIASARHADAAYFNPAVMGWLADKWQIEGNATYLHLTAVSYSDDRISLLSDESETEHFLIPTGFMVSPDYNGFRFGASVTAPYGLAKHWEDGYGAVFVEEFALRAIEINPSISYTFIEKIGVAAGVRTIFAHGDVRSDGSAIGKNISREMEGDVVEWGWNVALHAKPTEKLNIAMTYRSFINLEFAEQTKIGLMGYQFAPDATIDIPAPAVATVSLAYDILDTLTVEFTWDRSFWSEYKNFDFDFKQNIPGNPFEAAIPRNWEDSDAFRLGVIWQTNDRLTLMGGVAYDKSPVPENTLDFSVPDADAWIYSLGMRYRLNEHLETGISMLYDYKEERTTHSDIMSPIYGSFADASAILVTVGVTYTF